MLGMFDDCCFASSSLLLIFNPNEACVFRWENSPKRSHGSFRFVGGETTTYPFLQTTASHMIFEFDWQSPRIQNSFVTELEGVQMPEYPFYPLSDISKLLSHIWNHIRTPTPPSTATPTTEGEVNIVQMSLQKIGRSFFYCGDPALDQRLLSSSSRHHQPNIGQPFDIEAPQYNTRWVVHPFLYDVSISSGPLATSSFRSIKVSWEHILSETIELWMTITHIAGERGFWLGARRSQMDQAWRLPRGELCDQLHSRSIINQHSSTDWLIDINWQLPDAQLAPKLKQSLLNVYSPSSWRWW